MNAPFVGQSVKRKEDQRFLTGAGQFTDDVVLPRQAHACFLRSPHAHAKIRGIDTRKGALGAGRRRRVSPGEDLAAAKVGGLPCGWLITDVNGQPMKEPPHPPLAQGKVRYVGDHVAVVIAETLHQARDAAELIEVDYEVLPAVVKAADARKAGARSCTTPRRTTPATYGRSATRARSTRRSPARTTSPRSNSSTTASFPMRSSRAAAVASYARADDSYTLYVSNQNPHVERLLMTAFVLGLPEHKVRVIAPDVGGGFGSKIYLYAEETVITWASKQVNRPITVDRGALRVVSLRRAWPRPRDEGRAGARQERQVPRDAGGDHRQHGRLPVHLRVVHPDHPVRHAAGGPVHDARHLLRGHGGLHQHRAGGRLPRRGPARGHLRRGAAGRDRRARAEARPGGNPPAQFHSRVSVPDAGRAALRHRRLRGDARRGAQGRGRRRHSRRGARTRRGAASCAGSAMRPISRRAGSRPPTSPDRWAHAPDCSRPERSACIPPGR